MRQLNRSLALAALVCFVFAGCAGAPDATSSPVASASPSPVAGSNPSPSARGDPSPPASAEPIQGGGDSIPPFPPDTYARVVTSDLRVRSKPGVSDDSKKLEPLLQEDVLVLVLDGPVQASGYDWYLVQPTIQSDTQEETYPFGWVAAAGKDGEAWIRPEPFECRPLPASADELGQLNQVDAYYVEVGCWAGQEISFRARVGQPEASCGMAPPWGVDPEWLQQCGTDETFLVPVEASPDHLSFHPTWAPGVDTSIAAEPNAPLTDMPVVEVTGMFDHPAAQTCRNRLDYEAGTFAEPDPAETILGCRIQFVVTSMREVGG